jgi:protein gp37
MSDLFHEDVPTGFIRDVFAVMAEARQHTFQVLTKRDDRLQALGTGLTWPANVWVGVTVEARAQLSRLDRLRSVPTPNRFVSFEPLLGPLGSVDLSGVGWVIAGGESGPRARPMLRDWVTDIRDECTARGVPFFFKQWGGTRKHKTGRVLDGQVWEQMPLRPRLAAVT